MSIESAQAFIERMKNDEEFNKKVMECKDSNGFSSFAKAAGYDFAPEEIKLVGRSLSDEQLDAVAGGETCPYGWWIFG